MSDNKREIRKSLVKVQGPKRDPLQVWLVYFKRNECSGPIESCKQASKQANKRMNKGRKEGRKEQMEDRDQRLVFPDREYPKARLVLEHWELSR